MRPASPINAGGTAGSPAARIVSSFAEARGPMMLSSSAVKRRVDFIRIGRLALPATRADSALFPHDLRGVAQRFEDETVQAGLVGPTGCLDDPRAHSLVGIGTGCEECVGRRGIGAHSEREHHGDADVG